jgi:hypothetical protein
MSMADGRRIYNTFDAHRLLHWAETQGQQKALKEALFRLYFTDNGDPSNHDALVITAENVGLDPGEARAILASDQYAEAVRTEQDMDKACGRFADKVPMLANMVEGGKTPVQGVDALARHGYRLVIFPGGTVRFLARQLQQYFSSLSGTGSTAAFKEQMLDFDGLNAVIGTPELLALGRRYEG